MDYEIISAELEEELTWRINELRLLHNIQTNFSSDKDRKLYKKSLVVMLYSHFEGFCKFAFTYYIEQVNQQHYKRVQLNNSLVTACMNNEFNAYDDIDRKCKLFKNPLPDDSELHRYSRRKDFLNALNDFFNEIAVIPDKIIDTESNLKPIVLRKILFKLGFDISIAKKYDNSINMLLEYRNSIAHGDGKFRNGVSDEQYSQVKKAAIELMNDIKDLVAHSLRDEQYLANEA